MNTQGTISSASVVGRRSYQEDRYVVKQLTLLDGTSVQVLAVFDGHNGDTTAIRCAKLTENFFQLSTLEAAESEITEFFAELHNQVKANESGCTASIVSIFESHNVVIAATLGDSPVLVDASEDMLSGMELHNVGTNPKERAAVIARGAVCDGMYMGPPNSSKGLQLSRALGDSHFEGYLNREPEIGRWEIGDSSLVLVASDGVLGGIDLDDSFYILEEMATVVNGGSTAAEGLDWLLAKFGSFGDNTTLLVWNRSN